LNSMVVWVTCNDYIFEVALKGNVGLRELKIFHKPQTSSSWLPFADEVSTAMLSLASKWGKTSQTEKQQHTWSD